MANSSSTSSSSLFPLALFPCLPYHWTPAAHPPPPKPSEMAPSIPHGTHSWELGSSDAKLPVHVIITWFSDSKFPFHRWRN